jgi:hypothetical protein
MQLNIKILTICLVLIGPYIQAEDAKTPGGIIQRKSISAHSTGPIAPRSGSNQEYNEQVQELWRKFLNKGKSYQKKILVNAKNEKRNLQKELCQKSGPQNQSVTDFQRLTTEQLQLDAQRDINLITKVSQLKKDFNEICRSKNLKTAKNDENSVDKLNVKVAELVSETILFMNFNRDRIMLTLKLYPQSQKVTKVLDLSAPVIYDSVRKINVANSLNLPYSRNSVFTKDPNHPSMRETSSDPNDSYPSGAGFNVLSINHSFDGLPADRKSRTKFKISPTGLVGATGLYIYGNHVEDLKTGADSDAHNSGAN